MSHEVEQREGCQLIGFEIRTSNEKAQEIGEHWGRFMIGGTAEEIPGRADDAIVAAYCEYESDHTGPYTFFLGCPVQRGTEVPPGMVAREIPTGSFAHFMAEGEQPHALMDAWQQIWASPLQRRFEVDYEIHRIDAPDRVDVYVGIR